MTRPSFYDKLSLYDGWNFTGKPHVQATERKTEWKYPGPDPSELHARIDDALENNLRLKSGALRGPDRTIFEDQIKMGVAVQMREQSEAVLAQLRSEPDWQTVSSTIPEMDEKESLEQYLGRLSEKQQKIALYQWRNAGARQIEELSRTNYNFWMREKRRSQ